MGVATKRSRDPKNEGENEPENRGVPETRNRSGLSERRLVSDGTGFKFPGVNHAVNKRKGKRQGTAALHDASEAWARDIKI